MISAEMNLRRIYGKVNQYKNTVAGKYFWILLLAGLLTSQCKYPYEAEVEEQSGLLVIEGGIVKGDSLQIITVSRSTSIYSPYFNPVSNCEVLVLDEDGNEFQFTEDEDGIYQAIIYDDQLEYNRNYFVRVIDPTGKVYESEYEELLPAAPVDSIYFAREDTPLENGLVGEAYQFYIDLQGTEDESRYYMWRLSETYEYHSAERVSYVYEYIQHAIYTDSIFIHDTIFLTDTIIIIDTSWVEQRVYIDSVVPQPFYYADSIYTCWMSSDIKGFYSSSTVNLSSNAKKRIPLHSFTTQTDKLNEKYCLKVKQYSLSPEAYAFWNRVKIESEEGGGLYSQQPGQMETNLKCISDENENVLGYFWASSVTSRRIFISSTSSSSYTFPQCELFLVEDPGQFEDYPVYIFFIPEYGYEFTTADQKCMNCLLRGGQNIEPDYWNDENITVIIN